MHVADPPILSLKAVVELQASSLIAVLQPFQDQQVVPRRVTAQRASLRAARGEVLQIEVELAISDLTMDALRFIAAKITQLPITLSTVFSQAASAGHGAA